MKTITPSIRTVRQGAILLLGGILLVLVLAHVFMATSGTAHANGALLVQPHTCAAQPDSKSCDGQDPYQQQCAQDARTLRSVDAVDPNKNLPIGFVDLRYSAKCDSYWVRVIAYAGTPVYGLSAITELAPDPARPGQDNIAGYGNPTRDADGTLSDYTDMTYHYRPYAQDISGQFLVTDAPTVEVAFS